MKENYKKDLLTSWYNHKSALWWLFILYSHPNKFKDKLNELPKLKMFSTALLLYLHILPYIICLFILGRLTIFWLLSFPTDLEQMDQLSPLLSHGYKIITGLCLGLSLGIAMGITFTLAGNLVGGLTTGLATGIISGLAEGITGGISLNGITGVASGIFAGIALGLSFGIALEVAAETIKGISGLFRGILSGFIIGSAGGFIMTQVTAKGHIGLASGIALGVALGFSLGAISLKKNSGIIIAVVLGITGGIARGWSTGNFLESWSAGIILGIAIGIPFTTSILRMYYYLIYPFFLWPTVQGPWYRHHPVAWDKTCRVPFPKLYLLLVDYAQIQPKESRKEIERLINDSPSQRRQALRAKVVLLAQEASNIDSLEQLNSIVKRLPEGKESFLKEVPILRDMLLEISNLEKGLKSANFKDWYKKKQNIYEKINTFRERVGGFHPFLAREFHLAAAKWQGIVKDSPIPQVFSSGIPVKVGEHAFILRKIEMNKLENHILLGANNNAIILYGRRRVGKTTLLNNLKDFLPATILSVSLSMESASASTSASRFLSLMVNSVTEVFPRESLINIQTSKSFQGTLDEGLTDFYEFLEACNKELEAGEKNLLLILDEYEFLDDLMGKGIFSENLLATIQQSIQNHLSITWIFVGSHEIVELKEIPWENYLTDAKTIEVPFFTFEETYQLLTDPLKETNFPNRPKLAPETFGTDGIRKIYEETCGWPDLVQMVAEKALEKIKSGKTLQQLNAEQLENVYSDVISEKRNTFISLMVSESKLEGEWEYLYNFHNQPTQLPPNKTEISISLRRRELVSVSEEGWSLRVPLMARWLREQGWKHQPQA